jgi:hypothetical protein
MDVTLLTHLGKDTILLIVKVMSFLVVPIVKVQEPLTDQRSLLFKAHGFGTGAFEVTEERLGAYLPVSVMT